MAIYNPSPVFPSSGDGVNVADVNRFLWDFQSDAGETQTEYRLVVYGLDDSVIYDSTLTTSSNQYHDVPVSTFVSNVNYKWKITTNGKTSNQYVIFKALANGVLTISALPDPFDRQFYLFQATYTQPQGIKVKEFKWNLYNASDVLVTTSGWILGETLEYEFNGLSDATTYKIEITVVNQSNITTTSSKVSFFADYNIPFSPELAQVRADSPSASNVVDWSAVSTQVGFVYGTYQYVDGVWGQGIHLDSGSILEYDVDITIQPKFNLVCFIKLADDYDGPMFKFYNQGTLIYEIGFINRTRKFYLKKGNRYTSGMPIDTFLNPATQMDLLTHAQLASYTHAQLEAFTHGASFNWITFAISESGFAYKFKGQDYIVE